MIYFKVYTNIDPELVAQIIITELNNIINIIAPSKITQIRKNYTPYMSKGMTKRQKDLKKMYNKATKSKSNIDWNEYKNLKAVLDKDITKKQRIYYDNKLNSSKDRWKR